MKAPGFPTQIGGGTGGFSHTYICVGAGRDGRQRYGVGVQGENAG